MSWIGWDDWEAPEGYVDVVSPWPAWESPETIVIFFVARTMDDRTQRAWSQRNTVSPLGKLSPDGDVNLIVTMDIRENWKIYDVQTLENGGFGVWVHREAASSG